MATQRPTEWVGWRKLRNATEVLGIGVKEQVYQRALDEQLLRGVSREEAVAAAERKTADAIFGAGRQMAVGWQLVPETKSATKTACYDACMAEEKKSHEGEWDWWIGPVGMRPQEQRYATRRMLPGV